MPGNCIFQKVRKEFEQTAKSDPTTALVNALDDLHEAMMISDELVKADLITRVKGCISLYLQPQTKLGAR